MAIRPFSEARLNDFLSKYPLTVAGRAYVRTALEKPSRKVQGGTRNVTSNTPCPKMGKAIEAESDTVEARAILDYMFDDDVLGYAQQSPPLEIGYQRPDGKFVRTTTTPDFLVLRASTGASIEEWKPASKRATLVADKPGRYQEVDGHIVSPCAESAAAKMGAAFLVRFANEIPVTRTLNQRWLATYLTTSAYNVNAPRSSALTTLFSSRSYIAFSELIGEDNVDRDLVYWALANRILHFEFDSVELARTKDFLVFRDSYAMEAYQIAIRETNDLGDSLPPALLLSPRGQIVTGAVLILDGKQCTVQFVGETQVVAVTEDGKPCELTWSLLDQMHRKRLLQIPTLTAQSESVRNNPILHASSDQIERAIRRHKALVAYRLRSRKAGAIHPRSRTFERWAAKERAAISVGLPPIAGLIDAIPRRGFRGPHIDQQLSDQINALITEDLKNGLRPTKLQMYGHISKLIKSGGGKMITLPAFYARAKMLESIATIRESSGHKVAYQEEPSYWQLGFATPIHCQRPFELVHIDHTLLDLQPISTLTGKPRPRVWLTLITDAYSRRVLGFWLSFHSPSTFAVMMALYDMFTRYGRLPDTIITDWGAEFRSNALKNLCEFLNIRQLWRPKSAARFGAVLERMFGTTHTQLIHNLAGNTKARKVVRTLTRQVDPDLHAGLFLYDIHAGLEEFFFRIYDQADHPAWLRSPRDVFNDGLITGGARSHRLVNVDDCMPLLLPDARGGIRVLDDRRGIKVNYQYYGHPSLANRQLRGKKIHVKLAPQDPGTVLAYTNGTWIKCRCSQSDELKELPPAYLRAIYEDGLLDHAAVALNRLDTNMQLVDLVEKLNEKALTNRKIMMDASTKHAADIFSGMWSGAPNTASHSSDDDHISDLVRKALTSAVGGPYGELLN